MTTVVMFIAEMLWFMPLFQRQGKKDAAPKKYTIFAIIVGVLFGAVIAVFATTFFSKLLSSVAPESKGTWGYKFVYYLLAAGVAEELTKFIIGFIFVKLAKPVRKIDYIFIFGGAALGFALTENLINNILGNGGIVNALFPMHIMWQFYMGAHLYEAHQAKLTGDKSRRTREIILAFAVPIVMHGAYDFMIDVNQVVLGKLVQMNYTFEVSGNEQFVALLTLIAAWSLAMLIFVIVSEVKAAKLVKKSREADLEDAQKTVEADSANNTDQ